MRARGLAARGRAPGYPAIFFFFAAAAAAAGRACLPECVQACMHACGQQTGGASQSREEERGGFPGPFNFPSGSAPRVEKSPGVGGAGEPRGLSSQCRHPGTGLGAPPAGMAAESPHPLLGGRVRSGSALGATRREVGGRAGGWAPPETPSGGGRARNVWGGVRARGRGGPLPGRAGLSRDHGDEGEGRVPRKRGEGEGKERKGKREASVRPSVRRSAGRSSRGGDRNWGGGVPAALLSVEGSTGEAHVRPRPAPTFSLDGRTTPQSCGSVRGKCLSRGARRAPGPGPGGPHASLSGSASTGLSVGAKRAPAPHLLPLPRREGPRTPPNRGSL